MFLHLISSPPVSEQLNCHFDYFYSNKYRQNENLPLREIIVFLSGCKSTKKIIIFNFLFCSQVDLLLSSIY